MFDFFLAVLSWAPLGLLLLFWRVFPCDRGFHPIYREPGIEAMAKEPGGEQVIQGVRT
jgi:hypothetical protein